MARVTLGYIQSYLYLYLSKTCTRDAGMGFRQVQVKCFINIYINILYKLQNKNNEKKKLKKSLLIAISGEEGSSCCVWRC